MQSTSFLFNSLRGLCQKIHATRFQSLKAATNALLSGKKLSLVGLGRNIASKVLTKHNIKRIDRLLGNVKLETERLLIYQSMSPLILGTSRSPIIIIDGSPLSHCGEFIMLRAATPIGGRAITVYEECHSKTDCDTPNTRTHFLVNLKSVLPEDCSPIIVTDAGFMSPWFRTVESLGWNWIGRIRSTTQCRLDGDETWIANKDLYKFATLNPKYLGQAELAKTNPIRCNLFIVKQKKKYRIHKTLQGSRAKCSKSRKCARREVEPWLLGTSLPCCHGLEKKVVGIYKKRMQIEESFRDAKNSRFGFSMSETRTRNRKRFNILLLIGTLGYLAVWLIGKIGERRRMRYGLQTNTVRRRSVLSTFFIGCEVYKKGNVFDESEYAFALRQLNVMVATVAS
jgi:DDE family transposase